MHHLLSRVQSRDSIITDVYVGEYKADFEKKARLTRVPCYSNLSETWLRYADAEARLKNAQACSVSSNETSPPLPSLSNNVIAIPFSLKFVQRKEMQEESQPGI